MTTYWVANADNNADNLNNEKKKMVVSDAEDIEKERKANGSK